MRRPSREILFGTSVALLLVVGLFAAWVALVEHRDAAASAADEFASCDELAQKIRDLRRGPLRRAVGRPLEPQVARAIASAASAAGIDDAAVESIEPESPRRISLAGPLERPTRVALRQVTLRQFVTFLAAVADAQPELRVSQLRLSVASSADGETAATGERSAQDAWAAEATLAYPVDEPASPAPPPP